MRHFKRIPSLVQLLLIELIAILCLAATAARLIAGRGALGCAPSGVRFDLVAFGSLMVGLAAGGYVLQRIFWPRDLDQAVRTVLNVGPVAVMNPLLGETRYRFSSTHPAYALFELSTALPLYVIYRMGQLPPAYAGCGAVFPYYFGRIALALALLFPVVRLVSWYVLRRQVPVRSHADSLGPVLVFLAFALPAYLAVAALVYVPLWRAPRVDEKSLAGGLPAHPELSGRTVKLLAPLKRPGAIRCVCSDRDPLACRVAAVLLDLGPGGEVVAHGTSSNADSLRALADGLEGRGGSAIELYGILKPLPAISANKQVAASQRLDCGWQEFGPPPPAGRAYLEVELP
jgi:hypothetical protein